MLCRRYNHKQSGIWSILRVGTHSPKNESVKLIYKQELYVPLSALQNNKDKILLLNPEKYALFHKGEGLVQTGTFFASTKEQFDFIYEC